MYKSVQVNPVLINYFKDSKIKDLVFGIVVPTLVAFLILGISLASATSLVALKYTLLEAILVVGIPMLIGLVWNRWAGGASGFLLGSLYSLYYSDQLYAAQGVGDISLLSNLVSSMLIGYIAGALGKRSSSYRRMAFAGVTAGFMGSLLLLVATQYSPILSGDVSGALLIFLPRVLAGFIVPLLAKIFMRKKL
ncbi:MAG: hypothetical protein WC203_07815 [Candidatus Bathyarchaeia archaeon]